jgi:hypothetical protein
MLFIETSKTVWNETTRQCSRNFELSDVDECATANGGCQHNCINGHGFHACTCNAGYQLQADGRSCVDIGGSLMSLLTSLRV